MVKKSKETKERYVIIDSDEAVEEVVNDLMGGFSGVTMTYEQWHINRDNEARDYRNIISHKK